jgi:hypothetical protein
MEIKFNTRYAVNPLQAASAERQDKVVAGKTVPFENIHALEDQLRALSDVRPEKVAEARNQVADVAYPPNEVLESIANLLAIHIR